MNMLDETFVLSSDFLFPPFHEYIDIDNDEFYNSREWALLSQEKQFFMYNEARDKLFMINPTMKIFLQAFYLPVQLRAVILDFAKQVGCKPQVIKDTICQFFEVMFKNEVLLHLPKQEDSPFEKSVAGKKKRQQLFEIGQLLQDRYEISKELSIRSRSEIYLSTRLSDQQELVIKTFPESPQWSADRKKKKRHQFLQEFILLKELKAHPQICQLVEVYESEDAIYAVLDFIAGKSIKHYLREKQWTIVQKQAIITQILDIMAFVQSKNIIHGDIHASNFLIQEDGIVKLIDFDLANHAQPDENEVLRNGGIHDYIPPERITTQAFKFVSQRADFRAEVFQIGVLLYYIIYEQFPFKGFTWKGLAEAIQTKEPTWTSHVNGEAIPPNLLELLQKALQKAPDARFASAGEMQQTFGTI